MNLLDFSVRTDIQDADQIGGIRGTTTVLGVKPESRWTFAVVKAWIFTLCPTLANLTDGLATKVNTSAVGAASGVASLGSDSKVPAGQSQVASVAGRTGTVVLTKADVGLGNVDNTTDAGKPVSTATQTALDLKLDASQKGAASGVASLGSDSKLTASQLPDLAVTEFLGAAANQSAMLALVGQKGDWCNRTDTGTVFIITGTDPTQLSSWTQLNYPTAPVTSVAGKTGAVSLVKGDVGLGNVDNTADTAKPVSTAAQAALDAKADLSAGKLAVAQVPSQDPYSAITYASSVAVDFNGDASRSVSLTGNITFTSSNLAAGRSVTVRIIADSTLRTLTFPGGWKFLGTPAPANIAASKTALLVVSAYGAADTDVLASFTAEP